MDTLQQRRDLLAQCVSARVLGGVFGSIGFFGVSGGGECTAASEETP